MLVARFRRWLPALCTHLKYSACVLCVQQNCELCARKIAEVATSSKVVVEKSTVPVRTADAVRRVLMCNEKGIEFQVCAQQLSMSSLHISASISAFV
jgi:biotin synthase-related radical SAM superfamily protein